MLASEGRFLQSPSAASTLLRDHAFQAAKLRSAFYRQQTYRERSNVWVMAKLNTRPLHCVYAWQAYRRVLEAR